MANRYTRRADGTTGSIPEDYEIVIAIPTATQAVDSIVWSAKAGNSYKFVSASVTFATASSSGTLQVQKCPVGTAAGSGTALLTGTMSLAGTAGTTVDGTTITTATSLALAATDRLALDFGGTVTSLVGCYVTLRFKKLQSTNSER